MEYFGRGMAIACGIFNTLYLKSGSKHSDPRHIQNLMNSKTRFS